MESVFLKKAKERIEVAKLSFVRGYYCGAISNCYYALFNLMQSVVGNPPNGSWEHGGLPKVFCKVCYEKELLPSESLKGLVRFVNKLYNARVEADYYTEMFVDREQEVKYYLEGVEKLLTQLLEER